MSLSYVVQPRPEGHAHAFVLGRDFLGDSLVALVLGDNIFYGHDLAERMHRDSAREASAAVFAHYVNDPSRYWVVEFDDVVRVLSLDEKPQKQRSNYAITGLSFYDNDAIEIAAGMTPSARDELEITDVNRAYPRRGALIVKIFERGMGWLDSGTQWSLLEASQFIETLERRQELKIACPEQIAYRLGWIDPAQVHHLATKLECSKYGAHLLSRLDEPNWPKGRWQSS